MPELERPASELEVFELLICGFIGGIVRRARDIPDDKWNWSFSERTPTAREICEHAWMWLWCDRQEVTVIDPSQHRAVPAPPAEREELMRLLETESAEWRRLIRSLPPSALNEDRFSTDGYSRSLRGYLLHMAQHVVSKSGQLTMLHFELGLDGGEPYTAPNPNQLPGREDAWPWPTPRSG